MRIQDTYNFTSAPELIAQLHSNQLPEINDFTDNGKCRDCGNCCGNFLPISKEDFIRIKKYIHDHDIHRQKSLLMPGPWAKPTIHNYCPFLTDADGHRCAIYPVRPAICRAWSCHDPIHNNKLRDLVLNNNLKTINMYLAFFPEETNAEMMRAVKEEE